MTVLNSRTRSGCLSDWTRARASAKSMGASEIHSRNDSRFFQPLALKVTGEPDVGPASQVARNSSMAMPW